MCPPRRQRKEEEARIAQEVRDASIQEIMLYIDRLREVARQELERVIQMQEEIRAIRERRALLIRELQERFPRGPN